MVGFEPVTSHNFRYVNPIRHVVCFLVKIGGSIRINLDQMFWKGRSFQMYPYLIWRKTRGTPRTAPGRGTLIAMGSQPQNSKFFQLIFLKFSSTYRTPCVTVVMWQHYNSVTPVLHIYIYIYVTVDIYIILYTGISEIKTNITIVQTGFQGSSRSRGILHTHRSKHPARCEVGPVADPGFARLRTRVYGVLHREWCRTWPGSRKASVRWSGDWRLEVLLLRRRGDNVPYHQFTRYRGHQSKHHHCAGLLRLVSEHGFWF